MKKVQPVKDAREAPLPQLATGWCWSALGDLAASEPNSITDGPFGSKLKTEHYTEDGPRVIRLQNIGDGIFRDERAYISTSHFQTLLKHRVHSGDIVVAALGEELPRACLVPDWVGPAIVKADCIRFKPNPNSVLPKYLNFVLNFEQTRKRTGTIIHGVGRPRLNLTEIKSIFVPVAPINEQIRIVAKIEELFSDLDAGVANLLRVQANLKRYRAAVLRAAVEGKLTEDWRERHHDIKPATALLERILTERRHQWEKQQLAKFAEAGKQPPKGWKERYRQPHAPETLGLPSIPVSWCWASLEQIAHIEGGITKDQNRQKTSTMRDVPYLRVANVQRGYLDLAEIKSVLCEEREIDTLRLRKGDILFTEGGDRDKLGRGWVWNEEIVECIHQNHIFRARLFVSGLESKLVSYHGNYFGKEWFTRTGKQTTNLASINKGVLSQFPVPIPSSEEATQIVSEVERHLSIVDEIETQVKADLKRASRLRQGILKRAFEGRLVPQDPNDEPADQLLARILNQRQTISPPTNGSNHTRRPRSPRKSEPAKPLFVQDDGDDQGDES